MASDDGFREIQLNGKQLVFLFMATTIIAVVIFLCGVMVGRGVHNKTTAVAAEAPAAAPAADLNAAPDSQAQAKTPAAPPATAVPPPPPPEEVGGDGRADAARPPEAPRTTPAPVTEKAAIEPATQKAQKAAPSAPVPARPEPQAAGPSPDQASAGVPSEPAGNGIVLQTGAFSERAQAETLVKRLVAKGYGAYLVPPPPEGGMYRVRVGKFKQRREADAVMRRLQKEEQIKSFIVPH